MAKYSGRPCYPPRRTPPKIIIPTAWVRAPRVPQGAGGSGPETRAICMCVRGSAPRYACRGLATAVCRGVARAHTALASRVWLSFWIMSVSTDRDWPTSARDIVALHTPLSPSSFDRPATSAYGKPERQARHHWARPEQGGEAKCLA